MAIANTFNNTLKGSISLILGSDAQGDLYYLDNQGYLKRLPIGVNGQVLTSVNGVPAWVTGVSPGGNAGGDLSGSYPNPVIADRAVGFAKMQAISSGYLLGRSSTGSGSVEALDPGTVRSAVLGLGSAALANTGTAQGQVPVLDVNGQLPTSVLPNIALTTIQVVLSQTERLALTNVQPGDCVKQTDNGLTYMLATAPANNDTNWITIGDTTITASDITSGTIATARLGTGTANTSTFLRGDQTWQPLVYQALPYTDVTGTAVTMAANNGYKPNNAGLVTLTLPTTAAVDTIITVRGIGAGGWRIAQNANQQIHFGTLDTIVGIFGRLDSTHRRDCVDLQCVVADKEWLVYSSMGNIDVT